MAVGKGSIARAAKTMESTVIAGTSKEVMEMVEKTAKLHEPAEKKPTAKKPAGRTTAARKTAAKKEQQKNTPEQKIIGVGTELPTYLL